MRNIYIAIEAISILVILILLYANIFEIKHHSKKTRVFSKLLCLNLAVVVLDMVTWLDLSWEKISFLFWILITITYILPFLLQATFSDYVYFHISKKTSTNRTPFRIVIYFSLISAIIILIICFTGKLFTINNGIWIPGPAETFYYLLYIICLLYIFIMIIINSKKLGIHDSIAALSFCFFPFLSIILTVMNVGLNLGIPLMGIDMLVIFILLQSDTENELFSQSNTDELTGLYNRRAYEDDMMIYPDVPPEADFTYAAIDVNGLKQINDTLGHSAGDELICGAAYCLKKTFGNYGKVYRTGGDEFVSMFFADEKHLNLLKEDIKNITAEWQGKIVDSLTISIGYATKREFSTESVTEISKIADKRMYEDKARYYASKGVDRRGQNEAHKVLCSLYTKILKINITDNSFTIINMNVDEQTKDKGFSNTISQWLENFGKNGGVHPDDLEEYLELTNLEYMRNYFKSKKTSLTVFYRRRYDDGFKQVMMEIIPTKEYSDDDQSLFLYVKDIDL